VRILMPKKKPLYQYPNTFPMHGNVGVGTRSPEFKLHVRDNNPRILIDGDGSNAEVNFRTAGDTPDKVWALYKDHETGDLRFYQNGDKVRIKSGTGNIALGPDINYRDGGPGKLEINAEVQESAITAYNNSLFPTLEAKNGSVDGWAANFGGNVLISQTLLGGSKAFIIDHPLDPANKFLYHSTVESPDMMNIYCGDAELDKHGEAWIELPAWFEALNQDFHYQLTCIGGYAPVYVKQEIQGNRFKIAGGTLGMKVSWQVTGVRHDRYAEANRIPVEEKKPEEDRGYYLHPELYGQPKTKKVGL
jgi:hypothetical protein